MGAGENVLLHVLSTTDEFTSSNLPIVVINTNGEVIQDEVRIVAHMGIIHSGRGQRNHITDPFDDYDRRICTIR